MVAAHEIGGVSPVPLYRSDVDQPFIDIAHDRIYCLKGLADRVSLVWGTDCVILAWMFVAVSCVGGGQLKAWYPCTTRYGPSTSGARLEDP